MTRRSAGFGYGVSMQFHDPHSESAPAELSGPTGGAEDAIAGSRFTSRFEARAHLHRLHPVRLWRLVLGMCLLVFGIVNIFIPGPGGSVIILAALLVLAGESRMLARALDSAELRFAPQIGWALDHKLAAVLIVSLTALTVVSGLGYLLSRVV